MTETKSIVFVLKDKELKYSLPPNSKILINKWKCCVKSVCIKYLQDIEAFVSISSNLVTDNKYNNKAQIQSFNSVLTQFLLKGKANESQFIEFEKTWFFVNNPSEEIKLFVSKLFGDSSAYITTEVNMQMSVFFLLKKV